MGVARPHRHHLLRHGPPAELLAYRHPHHREDIRPIRDTYEARQQKSASILERLVQRWSHVFCIVDTMKQIIYCRLLLANLVRPAKQDVTYVTRFASRSLQAYWSEQYKDGLMRSTSSIHKADDLQKSSLIPCTNHSSMLAGFCSQTLCKRTFVLRVLSTMAPTGTLDRRHGRDAGRGEIKRTKRRIDSVVPMHPQQEEELRPVLLLIATLLPDKLRLTLARSSSVRVAGPHPRRTRSSDLVRGWGARWGQTRSRIRVSCSAASLPGRTERCPRA